MTAKPALPLLYCAIDTTDPARALDLAAMMAQAGCGIKLGLEFFNACGPQGVAKIRDAWPDLSLFLDLKYHDIPNTVASAIRAVAPLAPDFLNVHASGGRDMMRAAKEAAAEGAAKAGVRPTSLLGVTILTSLDDTAMEDIGYRPGMGDAVARLAHLTRDAGLQGVVCSAHEINTIRSGSKDGFILMVPGIRPAGSDAQDQKRIMTPAQAIGAGATHLVIGRPITQAEDPASAARAILDTLHDRAA